jgi:hypothetical protein
MGTTNCANSNIIMISWNAGTALNAANISQNKFMYRKTKRMEENKECKRKTKTNEAREREEIKNKKRKIREEKETAKKLLCFFYVMN